METPLVVIHSPRGVYHVEDLAASAKAMLSPGTSVFVADPTNALHGSPANIDGIVQTPYDAILADSQKRSMVILLSDNSLFTALGVDEFFRPKVQQDGVGIIGIPQHIPDPAIYRGAIQYLYEWEIRHESWEHPPPIVKPEVILISPALCAHMLQRGLFDADKYNRWPYDFNIYLSWVSQMSGYHLVGWGDEFNPLPPIYYNGGGQGSPPPTVLSDMMGLYVGVDRVVGRAECDIRETYKQVRGEPAVPPQPTRPRTWSAPV